ncbi:MAG: SHOCT domain-containing protein, partial [Polaribacter sp.]
VVNTTESKYDKLKKIKDLLDSGVLTKEEFEKENTK